MESQIWQKTEDKSATFLVLRGPEVHRLRVTGNMLTLKRNAKAVLEALQQGRPPSEAGANSVEALDARSIAKAEVSPGNGSLTLHDSGPSGRKLSFSTAGSDADQILAAILAQSGRSFRQTQEEIGAVEALLPPLLVGALGGLFWAGVHQSAGEIASGKSVEVKGFRRRGLQRMLITAAEILGPGGTVALGVALLALVLGWAALRLFRRPQRTVWLPESA